MTEIQDVTGTAFIVAEYRAQENAEQDPLYRDPIVPLFLSERTRQAADRVAADFPPGVQGVMLRTRQLVAYAQTGKRFFMSDRLGLRSEINRNGSSSS